MSLLMSKLFGDADCVVLDVTFQASVDLQYLTNYVVLDVTFQASVDLQYLMNVVTFNYDTLRCRYHITTTSHTSTW